MRVHFTHTDDFTTLRQHAGCYVDKTGFFEEFFYRTKDGRHFPPGDVTVFIRPRGFGRTLFLTMLASFFDITKDSRGLFAGLRVAANEELCAQWMNRCPVVFLTFRDVEGADFKEALAGIRGRIRQCCSPHANLLTSEKVDEMDKEDIRLLLEEGSDEIALRESLYVLTRALASHYETKPVVLIDAYDVPVATAQANGFHDRMEDLELSILSHSLKGNPYLDFAILTGCQKITNKCLFSGFNNADYYDTESSCYADIFGFTQAEVDQLLAAAGCEEKGETIREWCGGYRFGKRSDICCPLSVIQYLEDAQRQGARAKP